MTDICDVEHSFHNVKHSTGFYIDKKMEEANNKHIHNEKVFQASLVLLPKINLYDAGWEIPYVLKVAEQFVKQWEERYEESA